MGSDCPLDRVVVMVETMVVDAGASDEVVAGEVDETLAAPWTVDEVWFGCCCARTRQRCKASRPKPHAELDRSLESMMVTVM